MERILYEELTGNIIKAFYSVYNTLGHGFLEKVYENALIIELQKIGLRAEQQKKIDVFYDSKKVGEYFADIVVEDLVILELKASERIVPEHEAQIINYLKATNIEVGFLFNFGKKPQFLRRVFANERKNN